MRKKILSFLLCLVLIFGCVSTSFVGFAADSVVSEISALAKKFPDGKYWNHVGSKVNNPDGYTDKACTHHYASGCGYVPGACECNSFLNAIQCMGFAFKSAYDLIGTNPRGWNKLTVLNPSTLCVGDIIRYSGHSVTVVGVSGNTIAYVGANWGANCLIRWSRFDKSQIKGFSYVLHDPANKRKNGDIYIYEKSTEITEEEPPAVPDVTTERWKMNTDGNLNVRSSASLSASIVGSVPAGKTFEVTKKTDNGGYLWGYVQYGSVKGWAALNYSEYVSGKYESPDIRAVPSDAVASQAFTVSFSSVSGALQYEVRLYDADGKLYQSKVTQDTVQQFTVSDAGQYTVKVIALNSKVSSWKITGKAASFRVGEKPAPETEETSVETWKMNDEGNLNVRTKPSVSSGAVAGSIPKGKSFYVSEKKDDGTYLWGYVRYGSLKGWAVLNYPLYASGYYEKPTVKAVSSSPKQGKAFELSFSPVSGAQSYQVRFYGSDSKLVLSKTVTADTAPFTLNASGKFTVKVTALNSKAPTWKISSEAYSFTVAAAVPEIEKISLPTAWNAVKGESLVLKPVLSPAKAQGSLVWKSGNSAVATVSKDGKVTAVGYGTAKIYCTSAKNAKVQACTVVKVGTAKVKNIRQSAKDTASASAVLSWDKVSDATGYVIYSYGSNSSYIGKTTTNSFRLKGLKPGSSRKIIVYSYINRDGKNYFSPASSAFTAVSAPAAVTSVRTTDITETSAVLRWNKAAGADHYAVYRYEKGKGYVYVASTTGNSYTVKGKAGTAYRMSVRAVRTAGGMKLYSAYSDASYVVFRPAQTKLSATAGNNSVTLKWNKVAGATGYEVFLYTADGYKKLKTLSASANTYEVTGLKRKTAYTFKVRAYTKAGKTVAYAVCAKAAAKTK